MLCGFIFVRKQSHIAYKLLLLLLVVTLANETMCYFFKNTGFMHTIVFYNLYWYFRFPLLGLIFFKIFGNKNKAIDYFIKGFWILSIIFFIICWYLYKGLFEQMHTLYLAAGGVFVIINCLLLFYQSLKNDDVIRPIEFPFFISAVAFFLYFLGILPFFGIANLLTLKYPVLADNPSIIARSLSLFIYSFFAFDFFVQWKIMK